MFPILERELLAPDIVRLKVSAPRIAAARRAGQFVIVQLDADFAERVPLTIADADAGGGWIELVVQAVGATTRRIAAKGPGDTLGHVLGPLGNPTHVEKVGTVVCVAGGIGVAPLHPIAKAFRAAGNRIVTILGARSAALVIFEDRMRALSDEFILVTDDGSRGGKGLVTTPLEALCRRDPKPGLAVAIGPPVMMMRCAETTKPFGVPTLVSLNTIMIDGTGMCGGCRVEVGGETKFVCVDGPEFDGHAVDFAGMMRRLGAYRDLERKADHRCRAELAAKEGSRA